VNPLSLSVGQGELIRVHRDASDPDLSQIVPGGPLRRVGDGLVLSATDLTQFLCCPYGTALEMATAFGVRKRPHWYDPLLEILWQRGREHEERYVESLRGQGKSVVDLRAVLDSQEATARTVEEMRRGVGVVSQGALGDGRWFGRPDVLLGVDPPSRLGRWSSDVADTQVDFVTPPMPSAGVGNLISDGFPTT